MPCHMKIHEVDSSMILGLSWLVGWLGGQIKFSYIYSCELWLKQALVKETSGTSDFIGGDLEKKERKKISLVGTYFRF